MFSQNFVKISHVPGDIFSTYLSRESFLKKLQTFVPKFSENFRVKFWQKFHCRNTNRNIASEH